MKIKNPFKSSAPMLVKVLVNWLPVAFVSTVICFLVYGTVQQSLRLSANDPQTQIAQDGAAALSSGLDPNSVNLNANIDMATSLASFVIIFDDKGKVVTSSTILNGKTPVPPMGVFDYTRKNGSDRFTWQPQKGVRVAAVVVPFKGSTVSGFVLAGKSLTEVESRENKILILCAAGLGMTLVGSLFLTAVKTKLYAAKS
jgi:hypothetical protein